MTTVPDPPTFSEPPLFPPEPDVPVAPYGGSSGWSGSETSHDRADTADASGLSGERDRFTLKAAGDAGEDGITWGELADLHALHHGEASAALSRLHRVGLVRRLTAKRGRSQIYVLPAHVAGRPTSPYRPNVTRTAVVEMLDMLDRLIETGRLSQARHEIAMARKRYGA